MGDSPAHTISEIKTVWLTPKKVLVSPPTDDPHWHSHRSSYAHYCSYHNTLIIAVTIIRSLSQLQSYAHHRSYHHTLIIVVTIRYSILSQWPSSCHLSYHCKLYMISVNIVHSSLCIIVITVLHSTILQLPFYTLLDLSYHHTLYIGTLNIVITL